MENNDVDIDFDDQIINELTGKERCLNDSLTKKGNSFVKNLLANFEGNSEFDIKIISKERVFVKNLEVSGKATSPVNGIIKIEISKSKGEAVSALKLVRSILHEYIHADIYRKLYTKNTQNTEDLNFKTTYEAFKTGNFKASPGHETMAKLYINSMRDALKSFHKKVLKTDYDKFTKYFGSEPTDTFYEALAWQGLSNHNVKAYTDLSLIRKKEIEDEAIKIGALTKDCPKN